MKNTEEILQQLRNNPKGVRIADLARICELYFGTPRKSRNNHYVYRMPWPGDPRVNIQNDNKNKGMAKPYQVRQVIKAIEKWESTQ